MNCEDIQKRLIEYYYNEIGPKEAESIQRHLDSCTRCSRAYYKFRKELDRLKVEEPSIPQEFWKEFNRKVKDRITEREAKRFYLSRPVAAFVSALVLIIILMLGYRYYNTKQTERFITENYELLKNLELYENLDLIEHLEEIELLEEV